MVLKCMLEKHACVRFVRATHTSLVFYHVHASLKTHIDRIITLSEPLSNHVSLWQRAHFPRLKLAALLVSVFRSYMQVRIYQELCKIWTHGLRLCDLPTIAGGKKSLLKGLCLVFSIRRTRQP